MKRSSLALALVMTALLTLAFVGFVKANRLDGLIGVRVQTDDVDLSLQVPVALAQVALALAPNHVWDDIRHEMGEWAPAVRTAMDGLAECADAELVRVEDRTERVRITKRGGSLHVPVESRDEEVRVRVPTGLLLSVLGRIDERPSGSGRGARLQSPG